MPGPDPGAEIKDMRRRDPRLRQPADQHQLPQMPWHPPSRSSRASSCPSTRSPRPAQRDAPRRRSVEAPRPRTASPSLPPTQPQAATVRTAARNARTAVRSAGATRAREISPVIVSIHSAGSALDADPCPSPNSPDHLRASTSTSQRPGKTVPPRASHTVNHGRYLLFDWPAARLQSARAYNAVRRGGPTTFTNPLTPPGT